MIQLYSLGQRALTGLLMGVLLCAGIHAHAQQIPIPNHGFEQAGQPVLGWKITDSQARTNIAYTITQETVREGQQALHLKKTNNSGYVTLNSEMIPVQGNSVMESSVWLRSNSVSEVYYMIQQFEPGRNTFMDPNQFGQRTTLQPGQSWQELKFRFYTNAEADRIQIYLVFRAAPVDVLVDDIQLNRLSDYNPRYEPATPETLISRAEAEKVLLARPRATAEVKRIGQRPRLFIDGQESSPAFHKTIRYKTQVKDFSNAGVRVHVVGLMLGRGVYGDFGVWSGKNKVDFSEVDDVLWHVLRADPHAYILFSIGTDPYPNWAIENPDAIVTDSDGKKAIVDMHFLRWDNNPPRVIPGRTRVERYGYSYISPQLRSDTQEVLRQLARHIKTSLPGKAVIGYHIGGGNDGQMQTWGSDTEHLTDYSQASLLAFRVWLKEKYVTEANLQKAWNQPSVTFDTAVIPIAQRRRASTFFLNPKQEQDIADYNRFHQEGKIDTISDFAQTLRESHGTPIVLSTYYSGPSSTAASHRATGRLLKKSQFNYLASVLEYWDVRWPGGPGKAHQAWQSLLLHDAVGLTEEDYRSWKTSPSSPTYNRYVARVETAAEHNAMVRRDTGRMLADGQGVWWYDMDAGYFSDPSIMKAIKESVDAFKLDWNNHDFPRADVAVFLDETSLDYINAQNDKRLRLVQDQQITRLNSSGVPHHTYLQSDISNTRLPEYKLYVFLNAYHLTPEDWHAIQKLRRDGKTIAFLHAPGVASQQLLGASDAADAITKVTGIRVTDNGERKLALIANLGNFLGNDHVLSHAVFAAPTFAVNDANAQIAARYFEGNKPGVARRDFGTWKSIFFGGLEISAAAFNALAKQAGAWVAAPAGDAVYASQHFLTIHAAQPGTKAVRLLQPSKVIDLADGKVLSPNTQTLNLTLQRGETRWFTLQKP